MKKSIVFGLIVLIPFTVKAADTVVEQLQRQYAAAGAGPFDAARGEVMWRQTHVQRKTGQKVSCATCHGTDLSRGGRHVRTGKIIEPMSPRVNPARLSDPAKIEKWFTRNCKWTLGRACTPQEKGDILSYIQAN